MLTIRVKLLHNITVSHLVRILFLLALPLATCWPGSAASLQGKVSEIVDGGTIVVVSGNHPLKVRLLGVAPPEKNQPYAAIARQHLSDLVLHKFVMVHYSLLRDAHLVGQVLSGQMDVGAQMIRDGVVWYDKSEEKRLSETEQRIYADSQAAAQKERRGLWQDESPVAPWDFRRAQLQAIPYPTTAKTANNAGSIPRKHLPTHRGTPAGLASEDLMGGMLGPGSIAGKPDVKPISSDGAAGRWLRYQSADRHFSVLIPSDGMEITYPVFDGQGNTLDIHYLVGNSDRTLYLVMWAKGPNGSATDASATEDAVKGMLNGINRMTERTGFTVTATPGRSLRLSGYTGRQYTLSGGPAEGVVRILSKQVKDQRIVFLLCVLSGPASEGSSAEFLNSLKFTQAQLQ